MIIWPARQHRHWPVPGGFPLRRSLFAGGRGPAQNLCLALRAQGVATTFTTLLVAREPDVKELLGIPRHMSTACHIVAGYPARPFPRRLHRPGVPELAFADRYGNQLSAGEGAR